MNIQSQSEQFLRQIQTRNQGPARESTVRTYRSLLNSWILPQIGDMPLAEVKNSSLKLLVNTLVGARRSPSTIQSVLTLTKEIVASAVDEEGEQLYPKTWNPDFIDAPAIDSQDAPVITRETLSGLISRVSGDQMALYTLLAASGARIGEILSLQANQTDTGSWWDRRERILHIRTTLSNGKIQPAPKTAAGIRQVDLPADVNAVLAEILTRDSGLLFQNRNGGPARVETEYERLRRAGIQDGFHTFRRFRRTHLEVASVPVEVCNFWMGHEGKGIGAQYVKLENNLGVRREWCERAGAGFKVKL